MEDHGEVEAGVQFFRDRVREIGLDPVRIVRVGEAQPLRDSEDMGIDSDRLFSEGAPEHYVRGFPAHPRKRCQLFQRIRHLLVKILHDPSAALPDHLCLILIESRWLDILFQVLLSYLRVVIDPSVLPEQVRRYLIDFFVSTPC